MVKSPDGGSGRVCCAPFGGQTDFGIVSGATVGTKGTEVPLPVEVTSSESVGVGRFSIHQTKFSTSLTCVRVISIGVGIEN